jgi:putative transcriptional regulator
MRLSELRSKANITQVDLAKRLGISQRSVSAYENGEMRPSPKVATRIAEMFGLSVDQLWSMFYATDDQETA